MNARTQRTFAGAVGAGVVLAWLGTVLAQGQAPPAVGAPAAGTAQAAEDGKVTAAAAQQLEKQKAKRLARLKQLPCFQCHQFERFLSGPPKPVPGSGPAADQPEDSDGPPDPQKFAHGFHEEQGVGHCHSCHAVTPALRVVVRMEACRACH